MNKKSIQAIIFDFFGVISIRAHQAFLESAIPNFEAHRQELQEIGQQHDRGIISVDQYLQKLSDLSGLSPEECLEHMHSERVVNQQLLSYIRNELKPIYKIGMLSNAGADMRTFIGVEIISELFDDVVISSEVGLIKPDPRVFQLACERLAVPSEATIMVDDIPENCAGARIAGLRAVCYQSFDQMKTDLTKVL